jgi:hypothetical protein
VGFRILGSDPGGKGAEWGKNGCFAGQKLRFFIAVNALSLTTCVKTEKIFEK